MVGFTALKSEVVSRLGNRSDISSRVERWINQAFFELVLNPRFSFFELDRAASFVTVANVNSLDLSGFSDLWFILDIVDQDNARHLTRSHFQVVDRVTATTGQVVRYYRFGGVVVFDPTPDRQYNMLLRYRRRPADQSATNGNFEGLGTEWEEPIIVLATIKGFEALDQRAKAQEQRQIFEAILPTRQDVPMLEDADAETTISPLHDYMMRAY